MEGRSYSLDLARLALAALVIVSHAFSLSGHIEPAILGLVLGRWAVIGFFLISGFLITSSWTTRPQLGDYATRRVARIVPGFVVAFLISAWVVAPIGGGRPPVRIWLDLLTLQAPHMTAFAGSVAPEPNGALWTISLEAACYALVPICLGVFRDPRICWSILALGTVLAIVAPQTGVPMILAFLIGAMLTAVKQLPRLPVLPKFPDISYGVYLYGWPLEKLTVFLGVTDPLAVMAIAFPLAGVAGFISHFWVERPASRLIRRTFGRSVARATAS